MADVVCLPSINPLKEKIWKTNTAPKLKTFLWKVLSEALPVAELIRNRGMKVDGLCQICGDAEESINHLLFTCTYARHIWALSDIPHPETGFNQTSLYANINYLLELKKPREGWCELRRQWPWILWTIWKSRNHLLFQGNTLSPMEAVEKAKSDEEEWRLAQEVEMEVEGGQQERPIKTGNSPRWRPPLSEWLLCNIAFDWCKTRSLLGGAWVLRNERGVVICHSRRAFSSITSLDGAKLQVILWAVESMRSMRFNKVILAGEFGDIFNAVKRPEAWPSFLFQAGEILLEANGIRDVKWQVVSRSQNRGATFIAQSVTKQGLTQSYVARSHPNWLFEFFVNESRGL